MNKENPFRQYLLPVYYEEIEKIFSELRYKIKEHVPVSSYQKESLKILRQSLGRYKKAIKHLKPPTVEKSAEDIVYFGNPSPQKDAGRVIFFLPYGAKDCRENYLIGILEKDDSGHNILREVSAHQFGYTVKEIRSVKTEEKIP